MIEKNRTKITQAKQKKCLQQLDGLMPSVLWKSTRNQIIINIFSNQKSNLPFLQFLPQVKIKKMNGETMFEGAPLMQAANTAIINLQIVTKYLM